MSKESTTSSDINIEFIKEKANKLEEQVFKCKRECKLKCKQDIDALKQELLKTVVEGDSNIDKKLSTVDCKLRENVAKVGDAITLQTQHLENDKKLFLSKIKELEDVNTSLKSDLSLLKIELKHLQLTFQQMTSHANDFNQVSIIPKTCDNAHTKIETLNKRITYFEIKNLFIIAFIIVVILMNNFGFRLY